MSGIQLAAVATGDLMDQFGNALAGRPIYVYQRGTTTQLQVYADVALTTPIAGGQPLATQADGTVPGYVSGTVPFDFVDVLTGKRIQASLPGTLAPYVNVRDWGAVGDGVQDDTNAIQAAIDYVGAIPGQGGVVYFPRTTGYYRIARALLIYVRVRLLGESSFVGGTSVGTIVKADPAKTAADFCNGGADPSLAFMLKDGATAARSVSDAVTNGTTTVTSATAAFVNADQGAIVHGDRIPAGTTIATVTNGTTIVMSNAASGSGSGGALTVDLGNKSFLHGVTVEHLGLDPNGIPGLGHMHFWQPGENFALDFIAANNTVAVARSVSNAVTNATTTITSATAAFTSDDVNAIVTGDRIPATTKIDQVVSATTVTLNNAASGSGSGGALTVNRPTDAIVFDGGAPTGLSRSINGSNNSGTLLRLKNLHSGSWLIESLSGDNNGGGKLRIDNAAIAADPASVTVVNIKSENWGGIIGGTASPLAEDPVVLLVGCDMVALNILGGSFLNSWGARDIVRLDQSVMTRGGPSLLLQGIEATNPFNPGYTNIARDSQSGETVPATPSARYYPTVHWARDMKFAAGARLQIAEHWRVSSNMAAGPEWSNDTWSLAYGGYFGSLLRYNAAGALNGAGSWNVDLSAGSWDLVLLGATGANAPIVSVDFATGVLPAPTSHNTQRNPSGTVPAGTYLTKITYVTQGGLETTPSPAVSSVLPDSIHQFQVNPPTVNPDGAVSWNLYMTQAGGSTFTLQNAVPISLGQHAILTVAPTNTGAAPPTTNATASWSSVVGTFDQYHSGAAIPTAWTITGFVIPAHVGPVQVRFSALSKNASSSNYFMGLSAMDWKRTA